MTVEVAQAGNEPVVKVSVQPHWRERTRPQVLAPVGVCFHMSTWIPCFECTACHCLYVSHRRWDLPTCPRCGCRAGLFVECKRGTALAVDGGRPAR